MFNFLRPRPVAVVSLEGSIGVAIRPSDYVPVFEALRRRRRTRAVVVQVESRGGGAAASDYIHGALARLAADKPVFAFSGEICASGGYLIACAARKLVVQPSALIGSIGVISVRPLAEQLMKRVGVGVTVTKSGALKDMGAFWRPPEPHELAKEETLVREYFDIFLERVEKGRGMDPARLRELATGEVFSGRQAVELGLADQLGSLEDAVGLAAAAAGVAPRWEWVGPRRGLRARFFGRIVGQLADEVTERLLAAGGAEPRF